MCKGQNIDARHYSKYFKAFGDPTRLRILDALTGRELTVSEIVAAVGLAQPTVSRHLSILREAGVVTDRRDGKRIFYSLNRASIQNCCEGFCCCLEVIKKKDKKKS